MRGDRALHPDGIVLAGTFTGGIAPSATGSALLDDDRPRRGLVRFSRATGLPDGMPDILGCALRVPDAYGPGAHQDLPLASSGSPRIARHALVPARDYLAASYSCLFPYRVGGEVRMLAVSIESPPDAAATTLDELDAMVREGAGPVVRVRVARTLGHWHEVAVLRTESVAHEEDTIRFNAWNSGEDLRPFGLLHAWRRPAYAASQAESPGAD
jgi:hypothetical protein